MYPTRNPFSWFDRWWLDLKLGTRMLVKYPGLSIIGGIAMAVAIGFGTAAFAFFHSYMYPTLPLPEGDRIVALENWDIAVNNEARQAAQDFEIWRREMTTVREIGAFRNVGRNLIVPGRSVQPVVVAEITSVGFGVAHVAPLLGRPILASDERPDAEPVLVIGHDVWQSRFGGDPAVIGREVRLGSTVHAIVGVMPEGFGFPMNHSYWMPLRLDASRYPSGTGPAIYVFGRLAPGATAEEAQAELSAIGMRRALETPDTHGKLRPRILPYTYPLVDIQDVSLWQVGVMQGTISMLLVIVALNVGILVYARTATRQGEIAVRTALGASRARIVAQLFVEALVLAGVSGLVGLLLGRAAMAQGHAIMQSEIGRMPFWMNGGIPAAALLYVAGVVVLAAVLAGVIPAIQATRYRISSTLRELGGGTGMQLGTTWTILIVAQVAIAVAGLPVVISTGWREVRQATSTPTFAVEEYLGVHLGLGPNDAAASADPERAQREALARLSRQQAEMVRLVEAEPTVVDVSTATSLPGGEPTARIQVERSGGASEDAAHEVKVNHVAVDFFDIFDARTLTGRLFTGGEGNDVVVNRTFAQRVFGSEDVLGRRIRYVGEAETDADRPVRWFEIVGVVESLYTNTMSPEIATADVYHPLAATSRAPSIIIRMRGSEPVALADRMREIGAAIDPDMRVSPIPLAQIYRQDKLALRLVAMALGGIVVSVLMLSTAGIYALVSFTVSRRRKEIGIRTALGAESGRLLRSIFSRAAGQLVLGLLTGVIAIGILDWLSDGELLNGRGALLLPAISLLMLMAGLVAAFGPARRALRIQPIEALRED